MRVYYIFIIRTNWKHLDFLIRTAKCEDKTRGTICCTLIMMEHYHDSVFEIHAACWSSL